MPREIALVIDCGSTNIRSIAIDPEGRIIAQASCPNRSYPQTYGKPDWLVWNLEEIWQKIAETSREVTSTVGPEKIGAVIATTWGADGAPVKLDGTLTYPPISWQCPRTRDVAKDIVKEISAWEIFQITGYQIISFNTLLKMIWLRKNAPKALDEADMWLMMPGLIAYKLTGKFHIDPTSASTMMAMDLEKRDWSDSLLELAGLDSSFFPEWHEPGQIIGQITENAEKKSAIPSGTPVITGGHDTQFALVGSGAKPEEAILSSGTWEILSVRTGSYKPNRVGFEEGLIIEADVQPGMWNPQLLMIGSAVLEWIREKFFPELKVHEYNTMIKEAEEIPPGSHSVTFIPSLVRESGPIRKYGAMGTILGLTLHTSRGHVYRAALEGLSFQLREALRILTEATGFHAEGIRVVGGGSKNALWNQIRADIAGLPIMVTAQKEATALGAAITAFVGMGRYSSLEDAGRRIFSEGGRFKPSVDKSLYEGVSKRYMRALLSLRDFYKE
ncbi:MAG: FGGY family carbohydrate kinase [Candidatus Bathyarchaeia archaeon]